MIRVVPFHREHRDGMVRLCRAEGWSSYADDPILAERVWSAPGVTTVVAIDDALPIGMVAGFAQFQGDGAIQAHLTTVLVDESSRGRGIGRALVIEGFWMTGCQRLDLVSVAGADRFYESFEHQRHHGYRIHPS
jgi:GNAT superfamily N-acetyltransferase